MVVVLELKKLKKNMNKDLKLAASNKVEFKFDSDDRTWYVTHTGQGGYVYCLSETNTWTRNDDKTRRFNLLHIAINFCKRKGFNCYPIPEFTYTIANDIMSVFRDGQFLDEFGNVHSTKQASDIIKDYYAVNLSKMD
jgi:hypothetical protein